MPVSIAFHDSPSLPSRRRSSAASGSQFRTEAIEAPVPSDLGPPETVEFSPGTSTVSGISAESPPNIDDGKPLQGFSSDLVDFQISNPSGLPKTRRIDPLMGQIGRTTLLGVDAGAPHVENIIGNDDRRRVLDTTQPPFCRICLLEFTSPNGTAMLGTGWFIGPKTIVTAGHCIYNRDSRYGLGAMRSGYKIYAGRNLNSSLGEDTVVGMATTNQWIQQGAPAYDFGVLYINDSLGSKSEIGTFQVGIIDLNSVGTLVNIVGYPGDKQQSAYGTMWGDTNRIESVTDDRLGYVVDTMGGESGAPVIYSDGKGNNIVVGIHNYGDTNMNYATRINQSVADQLKKWNK